MSNITQEELSTYLEQLDRTALVELVNATSGLASKYDSKFHLYVPTSIAEHFHASTAKVRAKFGGNRSSKTYSHIIDYGAQFLGEAPKSLDGTIPPFRLDPQRRNRLCMGDYPNSFQKVIWPYIQELIPSDGIADVIKDSGRVKAITNRHGGFLEFMMYDQDVSKFQGSSRHSIGYDEEPPEDIRDENLMRLVDTDGEETFSLTPVSGALKYLFDAVYMKRGRETERDYDFILDAQGTLVDVSAGVLTDRVLASGDPNIHVFFACIFDNPAIKKEAAIRILSTYPKEEMIVRGKGHFMFLSGLVYKNFNEAVHVIEPFDDWWKGRSAGEYTLYIAIDPHPRAPHHVLFMVARRDGLLFIVEELVSDNITAKFVEEILEKCHGKVPEVIIIDPFAYSPDVNDKEKCFAYSLMDAGLVNPMPKAASKDKDNGIRQVQRVLAVNERGIPGVYVTSNCRVFRYEIVRYAWDDWTKHTQNTKGEKQKPIDKNDHMMENFYRLILERPEWISQDEEEESQVTHALKTGRNPITGY